MRGAATRPTPQSLDSRSVLAQWTGRFLMLPLLVVWLLLLLGRLYPAALLVLTASLLPAFASGVTYLARFFRRRRKVARRPSREELWEARPEVAAWDGLPPSSVSVRWLLGVAAVSCWLLAVGLGVGVPLSAEVIVVVELVLVVAALVALMWWWYRCDRAVWVWGLRWWYAWVGRPIRSRLVPVGVAALAAVGFAFWANALLSRSGVPWTLGSVGVPCLDPAHPIWGMCVSAQTLQAAVRGDAVGNLGLLGLVFCIGYQHSLGGTPSDRAESLVADGVADGQR